MADVTNAPVQPPVDTGAPASEPRAKEGFLTTSTGKAVAGGVALLVLIGIVGVVFFILALTGTKGASKSGNETSSSTMANSSVGAVAPVDAATVAVPAESPLQSTFTFRNVFVPTVKPTIVATESTTPAATPAETVPSTDVTSPTVEPVVTTLTLNEIVLVGDAYKGVFTWNGATYTAGNGETIGSSPWKVIEVSVPELGTALMLYGDAQQTIAVGESISK